MNVSKTAGSSLLRWQRPRPALALGIAFLVDLIALAMLLRAGGTAIGCAVAVALHGGAAAVVWGSAAAQPGSPWWKSGPSPGRARSPGRKARGGGIPVGIATTSNAADGVRSRPGDVERLPPRAAGCSGRALAAAFTLTLPLVGPAVAAVALGTRGRGEIRRFVVDDEIARNARRRITFTAGDARRLADGLSTCEALLSEDADERRATLSALSRRADARSVGVLRWAVGGPDPDLAIEAALALEDLGLELEERLAACRAAVKETPGAESALAAAEIITGALAAGLADASSAPALTAEARRYVEMAARHGDRRAAQKIAEKRARVDVAAARSPAPAPAPTPALA